ncbi:MAG: patatin-like phospholipase family protein [Candidatus Omnitrophica bacterium]|nr:patatin-like phospholipase family protein [Candidatus Omnitrophota bacterium]MDD5236081.1 patatin-like phospholipase family protein [Candidatus Omnitrophota bacterium]MDD5611049.1 patatin-like phospholipase family protein [Candidatus Omnitrophota bacterium]
MEAVNKEAVIRQIPFFEGLTEAQFKFIAEKISVVSYKKDELIYKEGDSPSAFYCIISGRVVLSVKNAAGNENILEYLHRGKYFGIISLLTGEPHSVTARAINDSVVLRIENADFKNILIKAPRLSIDLMQSLSRRLKRKDLHPKTIFESTVVSVYSSYAEAGKTTYAINLSLSLEKETHKDILLLDINFKGRPHRIPERLGAKAMVSDLDLDYYQPSGIEGIKDFILKDAFGIAVGCISYDPQKSDNVKKIVSILSFLVNDYHYIILDLPAGTDETAFGLLNQSDRVEIISSPQALDLKKTRRLTDRLKHEFRFNPEKIKIIVNENKENKLSHEEKVKILGHEIYATLPKFEYGSPALIVLKQPQANYSRVVRRVSRQLGDCLTGLALGVGAAYGLTHIGVLKVIEEEHIPIDIISGSSIGAFIAAFWAAGYSAGDIQEIMRAEFKDVGMVRQLMDITLPKIGLFKGEKISRMLKKYLGGKTFYDIKLPLKILACDVKHKTSIIIDKGSLVDAVLASCAMPGVFRPVRFREELLMDGGILNPMPTEILVKNSVKKIIAVSVTPSREDILRQMEKAKAEGRVLAENVVRKRSLFGLKWYIKDLLKVTILDFIFGSIEIMQAEMIKKEAQFADIILHPDTSGMNWLEFYKVNELVRRGEEETRRQLDRIRQLLRE